MRIIVQDRPGGPETLRLLERPVPVPGPAEVLIKLTATSVNAIDVFVSRGQSDLLGDPPFTVGWDVAGIVASLGEGVTQFVIGDRVFGMPRFPQPAAAYAEYVTAPQTEIELIPGGLDDIHAGAMPLVGLTAWQALVETAAIRAGERILIYAAGGGVGHLAVQIAKARGAHVTASAAPAKHAYLRSIGADKVTGHDVAGAEPFDVVLETIGGAHLPVALALLKPGGRLVSIKGLDPAIEAAARLQGKTVRRILVRPDGAGMRELSKLVTRGLLKVAVARTFPLAEAGAAQAFLDRRPIGKVVLTA